MDYNKHTILGRITAEPQLKTLPSGTTIVNFSVATNYKYKDATGEKKETTTYHNAVIFGKQAEIFAQYAEKGQEVLVEGRSETKSWEGEDGKKNYRTEIIVSEFRFGRKPNAAPTTKEVEEDFPF